MTIIVNQEIQQTHGSVVIYTPLTLSGMASSVRASVAAMENLLHGSVWSYQIQQLMTLRCAYVCLKEAMMTLPSSYLNSTFSTNEIEHDYAGLKA